MVGVLVLNDTFAVTNALEKKKASINPPAQFPLTRGKGKTSIKYTWMYDLAYNSIYKTIVALHFYQESFLIQKFKYMELPISRTLRQPYSFGSFPLSPLEEVVEVLQEDILRRNAAIHKQIQKQNSKV